MFALQTALVMSIIISFHVTFYEWQTIVFKTILLYQAKYMQVYNFFLTQPITQSSFYLCYAAIHS